MLLKHSPSISLTGLILLAGIWTMNQNASLAETKVYGQETLSQIGAGDPIQLKGTTVTGAVMTGKTIDGDHCKAGDIIAGQAISLSHCQTGKIMGTGEVSLQSSTVQGDVRALKKLSLKDTEITGNVYVRGEAEIRNTIIHGLLTIATEHEKNLPSDEKPSITLTHTTLDDLNVQYGLPKMANQLSLSGGHITQNKVGQTVVKVEGTGRAVYNGFTITGTVDGTQVQTPEGYLYLNGQVTSEKGPKTYGQYQTETLGAPNVEGPQWPSDKDVSLPPPEAGEKNMLIPQENSLTLILTEGTLIKGKVTFLLPKNLAPGVIVLKDTSKVLGGVVGGVIQTSQPKK